MRKLYAGFFIVMLAIVTGFVSMKASAFELINGNTYSVGESAKACWSLKNAKISLDYLEQYEYPRWIKSFTFSAKATGGRFCNFGEVSFIFIDYYKEDGEISTWTDSDGDTWQIAIVEPTSFRSRSDQPIFLLFPTSNSSLLDLTGTPA